ncbi:MAG: hypothetical protein EOO42_00865 [Flavobacteriales bacterium]|nr:MAG: hypothetical protein EOO42_00865 [Flavobacteriales bacterium]
MKKTTILFVMALLCLNICSKAQAIQALKVGDKLPETFWKQEHTVFQDGKYIKQSLQTYKDGLLILDYWATWCASCIVKFPELEALQAINPSKLKILLINPKSYKDTPEKIEALFNAQLPPYRSYSLPTVVADTSLIKFFAPVVLPQNIWIIDGQVRAITSAEFTNAAAIAVIIANSERLKAIRANQKAKKNTKTN